MRKELVDSGLLTHLARFYPSTCTIQTYTDENPDSYGQPNPTWIDLDDHVDIPCSIASSGGKEVKRADMTIAVSTHIIALAGYYPPGGVFPYFFPIVFGISPKMRAVVDGQAYDILSIEVDSHDKMTRLTVEIVR